MASSSSSNARRVTCIWDFENCWVSESESLKLNTLKDRIQAALRTKDPRFTIDQVIAVGPRGAKYRKIPRHFGFVELPFENFRCEGLCQRLVVYNEQMNEERTMRKTDTADLYMVHEIFMKVLQRKERILIITDDADFVSTIEKMFVEKKPLLLARTESCSSQLKEISAAETIWDWNSMLVGGKFLIRYKKE